MKVHFISIGGSVMHQLALALHHKGYIVTGSDDEIFEPARGNLGKAGLLPSAEGWFPERVHQDLDAVILGMHAKADNPELAKAQELGLPIYSFPEYIYQVSREKLRVVVGGSHGKTTTTSMIMHVLKNRQKAFDYLVGARLEGFDFSVMVSDAPVIVCEGDEYPSSALQRIPKFHFLYPHVAVITGIAWDHINVFPTFDNYLEQFRIFIRRIESGGVLIYNETDAELVKLVRETSRTDLRYQPYGIPEHRIEQGKTTVVLDGQQAPLEVFGEHNLLNLHAAFYACRELDVDTREFCEAIRSFRGAAKRLEKLGAFGDTIVFRDFAHAPSKVKATLQAVRKQYPDKRIIAALELHTYSSLNEAFMKEYAHALDGADEAAVFYSAHALELKRMPPLSPEAVRAGFASPDLSVLTKREDLERWLQEKQYRGAHLLLMSSGNYEGLDLAAWIGQRS